MEFTELKRLMSELKARNRIAFYSPMAPKATEEQIERAELLLGVKFPLEYKEFVREYGGGEFATIMIFTVSPESEWYIVDKNNEEGFLKKEFLAISNDQAGGAYGFSVVNGLCNSKIRYWDHAMDGFISDTKHEDLYSYIANVGLRPFMD